jgi:Coenzyme PQQ synthesis protein D (PqqD)
MSDSLPSSVGIADAVLYQELEDEVVLLNMANQQYYGLNDVGAQMWKCLLETGDFSAACDNLCRSYEADPTVVRADLEGLVRDLLAAGLLKPT